MAAAAREVERRGRAARSSAGSHGNQRPHGNSQPYTGDRLQDPISNARQPAPARLLKRREREIVDKARRDEWPRENKGKEREDKEREGEKTGPLDHAVSNVPG